MPTCLDLVRDVAGQVLIAGVDVVLDWNHWGPEKRQASAVWAAERGAEYLVHHLTTSLEDARAQLAGRNAAADEHSHVIDPTTLDQALTYYLSPSDGEGHAVQIHRR